MVEARHTELVNPSQPHRQSLTKNGEAVMGMTGITNQSRPEIDGLFEEQEMKLVPCRWSRTGWKYVEAETKQHKFFTNPNRANCHGYSSPDQVKARGNADFRYKQEGNDAFMTTNKQFYSHEK